MSARPFKWIYLMPTLVCTTTCGAADDLSSFLGTWNVTVVADGDNEELVLTVKETDDGVSVRADFEGGSSSDPIAPSGDYCSSKFERGSFTASVSGDDTEAKVQSVRTYSGEACAAEGIKTGVEHTRTSSDMSGKRISGGSGLNGTWKADLYDWDCAEEYSTSGHCTKYERDEKPEVTCEVEIRSLVNADISVSCGEGSSDCGKATIDGSLSGGRFNATLTFSECGGDKEETATITAVRK